PKIFLNLRIQRNVRLVVPKKIQLDLIAAGSIKEMLVKRVALGCNLQEVRLALLILKLGRSELEKGPQAITILLGRILPIRSDGIPSGAKALLVGVSILRNDRSDAFWPGGSEPEAHWRTVVKNIKSVAGEM